jgi:hypothetical protein
LLFENNNKSLLPGRNKQRELLHDYTIKGKESLRAAGWSPKGRRRRRRRRRRGETNRKKKKKNTVNMQLASPRSQQLVYKKEKN